jgi:hypothetical protein
LEAIVVCTGRRVGTLIARGMVRTAIFSESSMTASVNLRYRTARVRGESPNGSTMGSDNLILDVTAGYSLTAVNGKVRIASGKVRTASVTYRTQDNG